MTANDISFGNEFSYYYAITWQITATSEDPPENTGNTSGGSSGGGNGNRSKRNYNSNEQNKTNNQTTATKITIAAKNAVQMTLDKFGIATPVCNIGVQTVFYELYSSADLNNMRANDMIDYWSQNPSKWESIKMSEAQGLANEGWFVVAG